MTRKKTDPTLKPKLIARLKNHKLTMKDMCETFGRTEEEIKGVLGSLQKEGIPVDVYTQKDRKLVYHINIQPQAGNIYHISDKDGKSRTMLFGVCSDLHIGSKYHLPKTFYEAMKNLEGMGIKRVYVAGDICDGFSIYRGHLENIIDASVEGQTDMAAESFNKHPNLEFWISSGNHDWNFTQQNGVRPTALIEQKCDNVKDLGDLKADVIYHGIKIRLVHGASGRCYSKSYPSQVYLRDLFGGSEREEIIGLPQIIVMGHYHTYYQGKDHGIHIIQPSSFQDSENEYCVRRGLTGPNGAVAIKMDYSNGLINRFATEFIQPTVAREEKGKIAKGRMIK